MTPSDLNNLYEKLHQRVSLHVQDCCRHISVMLPSNYKDELAFYRLVNWGYVLLSEAAKTPIKYLTSLPPLRLDDDPLRRDISRLRTYVTHNLDMTRRRDRATLSFSHKWFKDVCGQGTPNNPAHYEKCCIFLANSLRQTLYGAIQACDLLDDQEDGERLISGLRNEVNSEWDAHQFDPFVEKCAARLGNLSLDLLDIRKKNLEAWRKTVKAADDNERERALELQIEATLLKVIGDALPCTAQEASKRLAISGPNAIVAALLLLRAACFEQMPLPEIIEKVASKVEQP